MCENRIVPFLTPRVTPNEGFGPHPECLSPTFRTSSISKTKSQLELLIWYMYTGRAIDNI